MRSPPAAIYLHGHGGSEKLQSQSQPHFLDSCFLCQRQLAHNTDIFMYRGNTPFCSQECRQEQIQIDDATERRRSKSRRQPNSTTRNSSADSKKESNSNKAPAPPAGVAVLA